MIAEKILPSFYLITIEGEACDLLILPEFNVKRIEIVSYDFYSDVHAANAVKNFLHKTSLDNPNIEHMHELNPEFYPHTENSEALLNKKQEMESEQLGEIVESLDDLKPGIMPVLMTTAFDEIGDFVVSRSIIKAADSKIVARVAVNPQHYMLEKKKNEMLKSNPSLAHHREQSDRISVH